LWGKGGEGRAVVREGRRGKGGETRVEMEKARVQMERAEKETREGAGRARPAGGGETRAGPVQDPPDGEETERESGGQGRVARERE
jgi:hypothetical protein